MPHSAPSAVPAPARPVALLGLAVLAVGLAACGSSTSTAPAAAPVSADTWAVVDGRPITRDDVDKAYRRAADPDQPQAGEVELAAKLTLLNDLIIQDLLLARGRALGIEPTAAEIDTAFAGAKNGVPDDQFQQELTRRRLTAADMRENLRRELVSQKVLEREVQSKVVVSDQDVTTFFEANKAQFNLTEEAHRVAQIVVTPAREARAVNRTGDDADSPQAATAKVEMLMGRLKAGASFAELAMDYSEDPETAPRGGDLGLVPISQLRQAPAALRQAVVTVAPGTVNVVSSGGGHVIVLVMAHEQPGQRDLGNPEVRQTIVDGLRTQREQLLRSAYLTALRSDASVQHHLARRLVEAQGKAPNLGPSAPASN